VQYGAHSNNVRLPRILALTAALFVAASAVAQAALSGTAERGDNCTQFNAFRIGYGTASGTIVDQSVVLEQGWNLVGWIVRDSSNAAFFVAYAPYFEHGSAKDVSGAVPTLYAMRNGETGLVDAYDAYIRWRKRNAMKLEAPASLSHRMLVAPCFTHPLAVR